MISNINEYVAEVGQIKSNAPYSNRILFRGQSNSGWGIQTSLERHGKERIGCSEYYLEIDSYKPLINPLIDRKFERKTNKAGYPFDFSCYEGGNWELPEMEYLAYLRHHGFPAPLTDWSRSLYIALFFACEDFSKTKTDGKVFVYVPPRMVVGGNDIPNYRHIGRYVEVGKRHLAQQSEYLVPILFTKEWEFIPFREVIESNKNDHTIIEIEISKSSKAKIMKDLNDMNINRYTMYMDQDSLIKSLADEWALQDTQQTNPITQKPFQEFSKKSVKVFM